MQILSFLIATVATGISCVLNLGEGFVGSLTWTNFWISFLVFSLWCLWIIVIMLRSCKPIIVAVTMSIICVLIIAGLNLYVHWETLADSSGLVGGIGLTFGLFTGLPFVGLGKLFEGRVLTRRMFMVPYAVFTALIWILCIIVVKRGRPARNKAKRAAKLARKMNKWKKKAKNKHGGSEKPVDSMEPAQPAEPLAPVKSAELAALAKSPASAKGAEPAEPSALEKPTKRIKKSAWPVKQAEPAAPAGKE